MSGSSGVDIVYLLCAVQGVFVVALLWARRQNQIANRILGFAILGIAASAAYPLYLRSGLFRSEPGCLFLIEPLNALYGPLFYLYARALTVKLQPSRRLALHFVPFALIMLFALPRIVLPGPEKLELFLREAAQGPSAFRTAVEIGVDVIGLFYFAAAIYCVSRYRRSLFGRFSNLDRINLRWLSGLLSVLLLLWLASMTEYVSSLNLLVYVHASWMLIMYVIAYLNVFQAQILAGPEAEYELVPELEATPETPQISEPARRAASEEPRLGYQKTRLRAEQAPDIEANIRVLFEHDKPYLDPDFTLSAFAERLGVPAHHVSRVLNERFEKTFYDFVNQHRVEELKRRLRAPSLSSEKILSIGMECGFSSKSTLNANFKKHTGLTPRQYRERTTDDSTGIWGEFASEEGE